jgi:hypothetical protein
MPAILIPTERDILKICGICREIICEKAFYRDTVENSWYRGTQNKRYEYTYRDIGKELKDRRQTSMEIFVQRIYLWKGIFS